MTKQETSRVTFTVGVSDEGLPAVYRTEVRMVEVCRSIATAEIACEHWRNAVTQVDSEMAAREARKRLAL